MNSLVELFVTVDEIWQAVRPVWHYHLLAGGDYAATSVPPATFTLLPTATDVPPTAETTPSVEP